MFREHASKSGILLSSNLYKLHYFVYKRDIIIFTDYTDIAKLNLI